MNPLLSFVGITMLLILEGVLLSLVLIRRDAGKWTLPLALGLPLGTVINLFLILLLTSLSVSLTPTTILGGHGVITVVLLIFVILVKPYTKPFNYISEQSIRSGFDSLWKKIIAALCTVILISSFVYGFTHSIVLPTFHYDSATNWNMRSKVSFYEKKMVFESNEVTQIRKPHYPFLYHALQVTAHQLQTEWNESTANGIHFVLSLSTLFALFLILRKLKGAFIALLTLTAIIGTPLFTLHLGQSYADITLVQFALLSLVSFILYRETFATGWFVLSAVFVAACVWTKTEGLFFCLVPWLALLGAYGYKHPHHRMQSMKIGSIGLLLSLLWPLFAWIKGLSMTPHGNEDFSLQWSSAGVDAFSDSLFVQGSFGILWFALFAALCLIFSRIRREDPRLDRRFIQPLLWGLLALGGYIFIYLFTSNVEYLILQQSFNRQMLLPAALLTLLVVASLYNEKIRR